MKRALSISWNSLAPVQPESASPTWTTSEPAKASSASLVWGCISGQDQTRTSGAWRRMALSASSASTDVVQPAYGGFRHDGKTELPHGVIRKVAQDFLCQQVAFVGADAGACCDGLGVPRKVQVGGFGEGVSRVAWRRLRQREPGGFACFVEGDLLRQLGGLSAGFQEHGVMSPPAWVTVGGVDGVPCAGAHRDCSVREWAYSMSSCALSSRCS